MNNTSSFIFITTVILLASVVIFSGLDTPDQAQFANYTQQIANVHAAVLDQIPDVATNFATKGESRTPEQIYYTVSTGLDAGKNGTMMGANITTTGKSEKDFQRISPEHSAKKISEGGLGMTLPSVRGTNEAWYVTKEGEIFNATGFIQGNRTYFTASCYMEKELPAVKGNNEDLAEKIAETLLNGDTVVKE